MPSEVTVVIPVRNGADTITDQLRALDAQTEPDFDIVIADNGSTDCTIDVVTKATAWLRPELEIINASDRPGAAHARNQAARHTRSRFLLFCDADDVVGPDWVRSHVDALSSRPISTGPLVRHESNGPTVAATTDPEQFFDNVCAGAGNMGIARSVFVEAGGFDEALFQGEDLDLCLRLASSGVDICWADDAVVRVRDRSSYRETMRQRYRWGQADVEVFVRHRAMLKLPSLREQFEPWLRLIRLTRAFRSRAARHKWLKLVAHRAGRVRGSIRHHVFLI